MAQIEDDLKLRDLGHSPIIIKDGTVFSLVQELEYYPNDICSRCALKTACKAKEDKSIYAYFCYIYSDDDRARFEEMRVDIKATIGDLLLIQTEAQWNFNLQKMVFPYSINKLTK